MAESVISVQGLIKRYGSVAAVDDISFEVKKGEVFGLLGPNGAGKTTPRMLGRHAPVGWRHVECRRLQSTVGWAATAQNT